MKLISKSVQLAKNPDLFDFNNDGKLDAFEKAAEFGAFMEMIDSEDDESENEDDED